MQFSVPKILKPRFPVSGIWEQIGEFWLMREVCKLNDRAIRNAKPGIYGDGGNLWLKVLPSGARFWIFRFRLEGRAHNMGLGPIIDVSLAEARVLAREYRNLVRDGVNPILQRRQKRAAAKLAARRTFRETAAELIKARRSSGSNPKHATQWSATLATYAFLIIGDMGVAEIGRDELIAILRPIWENKTETASRVRGRIEAVLDYATFHGWRTGNNPARWKGFLDNAFSEKNKMSPVRHHPALPWQEAPAFWQVLCSAEGMAAICLRFAILTGARSGEARGATFDEIDVDRRLWIVAAGRMKAKREHRIPLSPAAVTIVEQMRGLGGGGIMFPGMRSAKPLSDAAVSKVLVRIGKPDLTVHGFRSTFRDWVAEATNFSPELAEAALAHVVRNKVEAAYQRGDLLERRREMMDAWSAYVTSELSVSVRKHLPVISTP